MKERQPLAEFLRLVVDLDAAPLSGVEAAEAIFQRTFDLAGGKEVCRVHAASICVITGRSAPASLTATNVAASLQDEPAQVALLCQRRHALVHIGRIDGDRLA